MSSVLDRCADSVAEVLVWNVVIQDVPYADEHLTCDGHQYFHFVLFADLRLTVGEMAEERALGSACIPCALDDDTA